MLCYRKNFETLDLLPERAKKMPPMEFMMILAVYGVMPGSISWNMLEFTKGSHRSHW